jgi:hypothetical protein
MLFQGDQQHPGLKAELGRHPSADAYRPVQQRVTLLPEPTEHRIVHRRGIYQFPLALLQVQLAQTGERRLILRAGSHILDIIGDRTAVVIAITQRRRFRLCRSARAH